MNKNTTLLLIGRGHWGQVYKKTIEDIPNISLPDRFIFGRDYKEGLKNISPEDIDGVIIAATTSAHFEVAYFLLKRGFKRLLIEKPLTKTFAQAKKLLNLIQTIPNCRVLAGHILLYDPAYKVMRKLAQDKLGKILKLNYSALKSPPISGATVLQDGGPHPIYIFMDIAKGKPTKVTARPTKYDNIELILEFDNGLLGIANIGTIYPERKREIIITGEKGKLVLNEFMNPRKLLFIDNNNNQSQQNFPTEKNSLEEEILEFITYITKGGESKTTLYSGVEVVKIIELAQKSLNLKGKPISIGSF